MAAIQECALQLLAARVLAGERVPSIPSLQFAATCETCGQTVFAQSDETDNVWLRVDGELGQSSICQNPALAEGLTLNVDSKVVLGDQPLATLD